LRPRALCKGKGGGRGRMREPYGRGNARPRAEIEERRTAIDRGRKGSLWSGWQREREKRLL
jgi:hypothetical protein